MAGAPSKLMLGILAFLTVLFATVAIVGPLWIGSAIEKGFDDNFIWTSKDNENFQSWANWSHPDAVLRYYDVYLWNVTNVKDVLNGSRAVLKEVGPYTFRVKNEMLDAYFGCSPPQTSAPTIAPSTTPLAPTTTPSATTNPPDAVSDSQNLQKFNNLGTEKENCEDWLSYKKWSSYEYVPSANGLDWEVDTVQTINMFLHGMAAQAPDALQLVFSDFRGYTDETRLTFSGRTVKDILFGFEEDLIITKVEFPGLLDYPYRDRETARAKLNYTTIRTGKRNKDDIFDVVKYEGLTENNWATKEASRIQGKEGSMFKRHLKRDDKVSVYVHELFRQLELHNKDERTEKVHDIELWRFVADEAQLKPMPEYYTPWAGAVNVTSNRDYNMPMVMSLPHLLRADPVLTNPFDGLHPEDEKHMAMLDIEPNSGALMRAHKRLQMNVPVKNVIAQNVNFFPNVRTDFETFPVFWVEERGTIGTKSAEKFRDSVYLGLLMFVVTLAVGASLGGIFFILTIFCCVRRHQALKNPSFSDDDSSVQYHTTSYHTMNE